MIFKSGGNLAGVEVEFARLLGKELVRPVEFVELAWEKQIPALLEGRTDIIMSNMSVTQARQVRIAFTDPYMKVALVAVMRAEDKGKYITWDDIAWTQANVGVIAGTTGDAFVQKNIPHAVRVEIPSPKDGAVQLMRRRIDLFVHDGPVAMWLVSENEADLVGFPAPLDEQQLAWGIRRDDQGFLAAVNGVLGRWKGDGTVDAIVTRWLPWRKSAR
jgi:polar amino acid transport system substrate-binding protein